MTVGPRSTPLRAITPDGDEPANDDWRNQPNGAWSVRRVQARLIIVLGDMLAVIGGIGSVAMVRIVFGLRDQVGHVIFALGPLFLAVALYHRAYDRDAIHDWTCGYRRVVSALAVAFLALIGFAFAFKISEDYSRAIVLTGVGTAAVLLAGTRWLTGLVAHRLLPGQIVDLVVLLDSASYRDAALVRGARIVDIRQRNLTPDREDPDMLDRIGRALRGGERIVVACAPADRVRWTAVLKGLGARVEVLMPELGSLGIMDAGTYAGQMTAVVAKGPLRPTDIVLKRGFDLAVVLLLVPGLLLVTVAVAIAIKLDDGGPVFFRQTRVGQGNRKFSIFKFRTMRSDSADRLGTVSTQRGDARVTRVGAFLRRTSIDELPQLFNVLLGSMSIVGPRPHALGSLAGEALFWDADDRYWERHTVKPGLTGLAQVRGFRGPTHAKSDLTARVQADLDYINGWTIWRDCRIALETARVLQHSNAY